MDHGENYGFDVAGYLIVRGVLTGEELQACNQALDEGGRENGVLPLPLGDPVARLSEHPVLAGYLDELTDEEFRLDGEPRLLGEAGVDEEHPLVGGNVPLDTSRGYYHQNEARFAQRVLAIWVLADVKAGDGGFVLVPASHKSCVETPEGVLVGNDDMGLIRQPVLKAGDLLLCAGSTLHGVRAWQGNGPFRLLACEYAGERAHPAGPVEEPVSKWMDELTPVQLAVVDPEGCSDTPSVVKSDGETCWVEQASGVFHPSIYVRESDCGIDEKEFYHWDLCGHLVLRNVMDEAWLEAANEAIDRFSERVVVGGEPGHGFKALTGTGRPTLNDLVELPKPYCDPFREMIAHPALVQRMNWMMGSGFRFRAARAICSVKGTAGHALHSGSEPAKPMNRYELRDGRAYCESMNVAWQLRDVTEADGGFVCVPGSHKARYPVPPEVRSCDDTERVDHVEMQAGDVVMFMGAAQTHGAYPWRSEIDRRVVLINYLSRSVNVR